MATVIRMPSVLAGATEAVIANWLVAPGDKVAVGDPVAEIETEKALVECAAESPGIIGRLVLAAGGSGEIGTPIAVLISDGETDADIDAALGGSAPTATTDAPPSPMSAQANGSHAPSENREQPVASATQGRIFASPLVRRIAQNRGIDLATVEGTGPSGRIVRRDIERLVDRSAATNEPPPQASPARPVPSQLTAPSETQATPALGAGDTLIPHTPMRQAIARRLTKSKATTPHFYMVAECVVDDLLGFRMRVNEASPVKVSVNDFVVMAAAAAYRDVPEANVTWSEAGLISHQSVDISVAIATEAGLVTPVLRDVGQMRLSEIAKQTRDLADRARDRRLQQHELEGGVFSVSNLGMYGTLEFSAIISPPQSGILAVGAAKQQPVAVDREMRVATVMRCTLSVDHRAIDGVLAARWLAAFTERIEHPFATLI